MIDFVFLEDISILQKWLTPDLIRQITVSAFNPAQPFFIYGVQYNGELIGWVDVFNIDGYSGEVGICLPGKKGVGMFVLKKFIKWLFEMGFVKLYCKILKDNAQALRCARALGFTNEINKGEYLEMTLERSG
jgi:RimJ/RimL family protein N-acetyltransferase